MAKRYIGIDLAPGVLRVAVVSFEKGNPTAIETARRAWQERTELPGLVREVLGGEPGFGDRLVLALPARDAFVRRLAFPFADGKKIAATLPLELASRLPVPVDECALAWLSPQPAEEGYAATAVAVRANQVRELLAPFDAGGTPVQILDLAPYALAAGLRETVPAGILICVGEREATVSLVRDGANLAYRVLPLAAAGGAPDLAARLDREETLLRKAHGEVEGRTVVFGPGADEGLLTALNRAGNAAVRPGLAIAGHTVPDEFVPAAACALRGSLGDRGDSLNFRQGEFALRSEWARIKGRLVTIAAVLLVTLLVFGASAWLGYATLDRRAENLHQEMVRIYRSAFPGATAIVDVPLQMQSKIRELQDRAALLAGGDASGPLEVLEAVSANTPAEVTVDIRDFSYTPEGVRMEGTTDTFEATNTLARSLAASPLFADAQIADAKMSVDGQTVDFRINLQYRKREVVR